MRPSPREFAEFNGLLSSLVEKGLPLAPAVDLMAGVVRDGVLRRALRGVAQALGEGVPLPDALARFPEAFPPEYCALIRAGVDSGRLAEALRTSQVHLDLRARLRSKMVRMLLYLLAVAIIGELVLVITVIAGRYVSNVNNQIYVQLEIRERQPLSEILSSTLESGWILTIAWPLAVLAAAGAYWVLQKWTTVGWIGYILPFWGPIQRSRDLALFCCALGLRLRSGAPMVAALRSAKDSVPNRRFRRIADQLIHRVEEGESLSSALYYLSFFPRTLAWAVSLGEENGEVPRTFDTFTTLYTTQMERNFEVCQEILSPLGLLVVGNVGLLAAAMMLAPMVDIFRIYSILR